MSRFELIIERIYELQPDHLSSDFTIRVSPEFRNGLLDEARFSKKSPTDDSPYQFHGYDVVVDESIPGDSFYIEDG